jgi:hypothetical protein
VFYHFLLPGTEASDTDNTLPILQELLADARVSATVPTTRIASNAKKLSTLTRHVEKLWLTMKHTKEVASTLERASVTRLRDEINDCLANVLPGMVNETSVVGASIERGGNASLSMQIMGLTRSFEPVLANLDRLNMIVGPIFSKIGD